MAVMICADPRSSDEAGTMQFVQNIVYSTVSKMWFIQHVEHGLCRNTQRTNMQMRHVQE